MEWDSKENKHKKFVIFKDGTKKQIDVNSKEFDYNFKKKHVAESHSYITK